VAAAVVKGMTRHLENHWAALVVLCVGMLMIVLDATVVNVALPSIQDDLGFSQSSLAWVVNAYLIAFGGLLLLAGRAGDLLGQRNVFLAGLVLFTAASVACAVAQTQSMLINDLRQRRLQIFSRCDVLVLRHHARRQTERSVEQRIDPVVVEMKEAH